MSNSSLGVPEFVRVAPAPGCLDPASLPQIQLSHLNSIQTAAARASQTPPPTPLFHSPSTLNSHPLSSAGRYLKLLGLQRNLLI